ncbi:nuclease-related domain-containing protein [Aerococcus kribbianus]|uniref:Nuclease-related domain-containing protein n=1 Tax=Aerococcus kribbianus TaxID=2999064 RepID=A0A9X3FMW1_9LACT|nr:nuclease-related domain-containing protein [Aerococcus sp. YH-aer222]MCZ0725477.1 nuclease-related domain-containing protein [Aerococcus sp. YH-aer222]
MSKFTRYQLLEEMYLRDLITKDSKLYRDYYWRKLGAEGEQEMGQFLQQYLPKQCQIIHDITFEFSGKTQCDFLLLGDRVWWLVEVKNYNGVMEYKNNQSLLRGEALRSDQFAAMRNRQRIIENMAHSVDPTTKVIASMVFIHPNSEVKWDSDEQFTIITRNQIKRHLQTVTEKYNFNNYSKQDLEAIRRHQINFKEEGLTIDENTWTKIRKGCRCPNCQSYQLQVKKKYMYCLECKEKISKADMVFNVYKQLSLLSYNDKRPINRCNILNLAAQQFADSVITRSLKSYHIAKSNGKNYCYHNYYLQK